ncbi:glycosyltransferase family 4 protein [Haliea sp. E1-2-M8]|uniref:glycosyltransferase family 4 protein n=1 Tax=Haliea sp. E1-2-M8 TaxID=3064706 RepID=UPI002723DE3D|nr:glycosyltransferase family 4 protein [Haliea sp. E1-2-M8]MDO8862771.1 glycosyltransferase family 4 protein [Haliea sp. E1-2-M8]
MAASTAVAEASSPAPAALAAVRPSLRIALLGYRSKPHAGGQGVYIKYLSKALVDAGHRVDVISGPPYPEVDPRVRLIELPSLDLYENGLWSLRPHHLRSLSNIIEWTSKLTGGFAEPYTFGRRAVRYLRRHRQDYDLIHDNQSLSHGMVQLQAMGLPLVTTVHHPITSDLRIALSAAPRWHQRLLIRRWHWFLQMQRKVIKQLHHVVTVSDYSRQDIARDFGLQPAGIALVHNGIDTEEFRPLPGVIRKPLRIMATASADAPLKGLRYLLQAFARLLPRYPELELLLVSKPQPGGRTERLIKRLDIAGNIRFVNGISTAEMVHYYAEASIAVVPSIYEGFGLPAGEAMACGVPVVSTDGGALPEVVGDAGIIVPVRDADALEQAIESLLLDPQRREQLGVAGRQRILERFSWQVCAQAMDDYYRRVIADANR